MKKIITSAFLLAFSIIAFAQKEHVFDYDKKTGEFKVDNQTVFVIEKRKHEAVPTASNFYFNNTNGKHLLFAVYRVGSPSKGDFFEITFVGLDDSKCEIRYFVSVTQLAKFIYEKKLITNGELDPAEVKSFVMENGNTYSAK